jgi:hypothetical protein
MEKEFVTYEQALALKELGFDEPCLAFYSPKEELHPVFQEPSKGPYFNNGSFIETLRAPLYQQAFRWFRDKHGINVLISINWGEGVIKNITSYGKYSCYLQHKSNGDDSIGSYVGIFNTYEEAEQACLDKLIEICKNK